MNTIEKRPFLVALASALVKARTNRIIDGLPMSRAEASDLTGLSEESIADYEKMKTIPSAPALMLLAEAYGVSVESLLPSTALAREEALVRSRKRSPRRRMATIPGGLPSNRRPKNTGPDSRAPALADVA